MKWFLICTLYILVTHLISAQPNREIDSLLNELKEIKADTAKVYVLIKLGKHWVSAKDKSTSLKYFKEALFLAQKISFSKGEAMAYYELGYVCGIQSNFTEAVVNYDASQKIFQQLNDLKGVANSYAATGIAHKNQGNYPEALKYQLLSLELFKKLNEKKGIANAYLNIGLVFKLEGNYNTAIKNYQQSLVIAQELDDKSLSATLYSNIGNVYAQQGVFADALKNQLAALKIHQELGNKGGIATVYNSIGNIYAQTNDLHEALKNYQKSLEIMKELDIKKGISTAHNNIGTINKNLGLNDEAIFHFEAALSISEKINDKKGVAQALHGLGNLYMRQNRLDEGIKCHLSSLKIGEEIGSKDQMIFAYSGIGKILIKQGCNLEDINAAKVKYSEAVDYYMKALSLAEETDSKDEKSNFYEALSEAYRLLDNYPLALQYYTRHISLRDSIHNDKNNRKLEQLRTQYEVEKAIASEKAQQDRLLHEQRLIADQERAELTARNLYHQQLFALLTKEKYLQQLQLEKNEADLFAQLTLTQKKESDLKAQKADSDKKQEQFNKENEIRKLELKKEKLTKNYFIAALVLFLVLSFFIYRNYQTTQEVRLLTLRNKIAVDLHDDVGSTLSSISMFSQMAQLQSKEHIPALETIGESSRKMLEAMSDIVWSIKPENDQFEKVIMHMREFAYQLLGTKQIEFEFDADDDISKINLPMETRKNLYLIFKEATNNMAKYSKANNAKFALKGENDKLTMIISDDGKGFDTTQNPRGNGLMNMNRRAQEIGAKLLIDSKLGIGTTIKLELTV